MIAYYYLLTWVALIFSGSINGERIESPAFQQIMDSAGVKGAILIYDLEEDLYYSNDFEWANSGQLPASTFKIVNSIIALETGVVENVNHMFRWDGEKRWIKDWEQDLDLTQAFHYSCVPCYQEVARKIGPDRMEEYLQRLEYGQMEVSADNIDMFWLQGGSKVNQFQQIEFLKRFYLSRLPISGKTEGIMKKMMVMEENEASVLRGKTGWSIWEGKDNGWFVGYLERDSKVYFFATNVEPGDSLDMKDFPGVRKGVTLEALKGMGLIP